MKKKLFIAFLTVLLVEIAISTLLSTQWIKRNYEKDLEGELLRSAKLLHAFFSELDIQGEEDYQMYVNHFATKINYRITLIKMNGVVIADSEIAATALENHKDRDEVKEALEGEVGISKRYSKSIDKDLFYLAYPVELKEVKVIRLSKPLREIKEDSKALYTTFFISLSSGLFAALLIAFFFIRSINKPIKELCETSIAIQHGDYGKTILHSEKDELGLLTRHFNQMSIALKESFEKSRDENIKSKAILSSMTSGLIAFDSENKIIAVNKSAETLFSIKEEDFLGKSPAALLEHKKVSKEFYDCIKNFSENPDLDVNFGKRRTLSIRFNHIYSHDGLQKKGLLLIAEDVTDVRKLERIRKDFVANVSHELGTPLTSIKGFAETLKEDLSQEQRNRFVDIILVESNRLQALTKDLLSLSDIENIDKKMPLEPIHTKARIEACLEMLEAIAEQKNISLSCEMPSSLSDLQGKALWFDQIIINLVDNAIKYTSEQGKIKLSLKEKEDNLIIQVADTGIGIPKESLDRIFERFYRVDKARSRKAGGTGLGLAIVKHIVIAFAGTIHVESELNMGTTFTVTLPISGKEVAKS